MCHPYIESATALSDTKTPKVHCCKLEIYQIQFARLQYKHTLTYTHSHTHKRIYTYGHQDRNPCSFVCVQGNNDKKGSGCVKRREKKFLDPHY